jgi:tetratricopeptide (TPR) repeat protein
MKRKIFIAFIVSVILCCQVEKAYPLPDATDYIVNALAQDKLVFIGEDHFLVNEELFMAENLQAFYDAGLRYIFLEGAGEDDAVNQSPVREYPEFRILTFPPWRADVGGKYEGRLFNQAIRKINNAVPEEERIRAIFPEASYKPTTKEGIDLNKRDQTAFKHISEFMETLPHNKKAMIFYGSGHGQTKPTEWQVDGEEPFLWTPMAVYLKERYGNGFISICFVSNKDDMRNISLEIPQLKDSESKSKIVLSNSKNDIVNNNYIKSMLSRFDAVILDHEAVFGTGYNYAPTHENLFVMYNGLQDLENSIDNWKNDVAIFRFQDQGQYLQYIYYLKLWLGDKFDYQLWDTIKPLHTALDELNSTVFMKKNTINDRSVSINISNYCKVMLMSGVEPLVSDALSREDMVKEGLFPWIVDHMKEAIELFPQDLWPYYWLAYAETELENYEEAIEHWEYIIGQPLAYCMETLPRVYQQLSKCYAAEGNYAKSDIYKKMGECLKNEHNLIVTNLNDVK